jgi:hypothetical protein
MAADLQARRTPSLHRLAGAGIQPSVSFRFFAVPAHVVAKSHDGLATDDLVEPSLPPTLDALERALTGAEFRDIRARDRLRGLLLADQEPPLGSPGDGWGPSAVFAQPPQDLPALLRLADQLENLAQQEAGERALVWKCAKCGTRYAVPVSLVRPVAIRCERCSTAVDLQVSSSLGEESLLDPSVSAVNQARRELATFFREAMARGWPVLVSASASLRS